MAPLERTDAGRWPAAAAAGLPADQIGKINVNEFSTYVAVARAAAKQALAALNDRPVKGKRVKARLLA